MEAIGKLVADAVLGIDTLWGGDVMCPSGTGRFIADSWFKDEPLPTAYTVPAAARVRASGGVSGKKHIADLPSKVSGSSAVHICVFPHRWAGGLAHQTPFCGLCDLPASQTSNAAACASPAAPAEVRVQS